MQLIVKDWIYKNPCVCNVAKGDGEDKIENTTTKDTIGST